MDVSKLTSDVGVNGNYAMVVSDGSQWVKTGGTWVPTGANYFVDSIGVGTGVGDMLKSVYDPNNDGKVVSAATADSVDWTGVANKPVFANVATSGLASDLVGGAPSFNVDGPAGTDRIIRFQSNTVNRWGLRTNTTAESGNNVGSNFQLVRYDDAGNLIGNVATFYRDDAYTVFNGYVESLKGLSVNNSANNDSAGIDFYNLNTANWWMGKSSGAAGDFVLERYNDSGSYLGDAYRVDRSTGLITLGAGQLKFPATQNSSSNGNTLDDYEEGTWTPAYFPTSGAFASITYVPSSTYAVYTKIGRIVFVAGSLATNAFSVGTATNSLQISGLPFTPAAGIIQVGSGACPYSAGFAASQNTPTGWSVIAGTPRMALQSKPGGTLNGVGVQCSCLNNAAGTQNSMLFAGHYIAD